MNLAAAVAGLIGDRIGDDLGPRGEYAEEFGVIVVDSRSSENAASLILGDGRRIIIWVEIR